ncbi:MAG: ShlB/FhaC/HecB family hemolysin secretion/activation protein [Polaromonas sp.]|uniref:ShlB/FhaC/HecB family hemolysin secretion/activation protein n=1 Tax=Polaromonas sp. TaxID=1869339 RepID=UPI00248A1DDC|nr:ShlB/FhaC/HecB family hemolysin secretion/activation protein [Polaromonas sp.]MDI1271637.1 ShlB/FhaC/HecB family hemolysin secretion/activation protein [Polaromonas sp.]
MTSNPAKRPTHTHRYCSLSLAIAGVLGAWGPAAPAAAQTQPDAGQMLRENQPRPVLPAPPATPALRVEEQPAGTPSSSARFAITQVRVTGSTAFTAEQLAAVVSDLPRPDRSLADLEAAARRISAYYRERGYAVARAFVPAQDIRGGVATLSVVEGTLGKKTLDNQSGLPSGQMQPIVDALPSGQPVRTVITNRALLLLGQLPGVGKVDGQLRPGDILGSSDLLVTVAPGKAMEGSVSLDNFGNRYTGATRLSGQLALNNPLGLADRFSLRGTTSNEGLLFGRAAWDAAVGNDGLRLGVSASASRYELAREFAALQAHGTANTAGVYGSYPLLLATDASVRLGSNLEKRWIRDDIDVIGSSVRKSATALVLDLSGELLDGLGGGGLTTWRFSPTLGDLSIDNPAFLALDQTSTRTAGHYAKWTASLAREQRLAPSLSLYGSVSAQRASKNLDSSEKFVLGGVYGIRAYPQGEAAGDQGWLASLELRQALAPGWQGSVFYDAGGVDINRRPYIAGNNKRRLSGYGIGLAASLDAFSVSATLAWRGGSAAPTSDRDKSPRLWLQGNWRF